MSSTAPQFLILAAGRSSRYGRPKQVDPLGPGGGSILAYTVVDALRAGFGEILLVTSRDLRPVLDKHLRDVIGPDLPLRYAFQRLDDLPDELAHVAPSRRRPWGTGQAVLAAEDLVDGPFAVANADDWYGPEALAALVDALSEGAGGEDCQAVALAYPMEATLSPNGGVSRGWIKADDEGRVTRVLEMTQVRSAAGGGMVGIGPDGTVMPIPPTTPASMNLWGFQPCILPLLRDGFLQFLYDEGASETTEYPLSTAVDEFMNSGALDLKVITRGRRWFGVTHPGDADAVSRQLELLHREGVYASPLSRTLD